ncbi:type III secretion system protein SsaP [Yersinia aldovae]|uniref:Secretion system apparatus protein ssaP n=1 Tax=Yersinia aldovae TaxID=29483 RepID=UPI0005EA56FC|nr:Secretion system apparatus protein ssaP [Yersinia aldovae]CNH68245.1 type III secretion system protein SsaP [Yersinia aldovae]
MNIIRIEGCLWHTQPDNRDEEVQRQPGKTRFTQLMGQITAAPGHAGNKSALLRRQTSRYQVLGGPAAGLVCEIEVLEGKTYLNVLVPQYASCNTLKHFSAWLNAGLLAAGHQVTLEIKYVNDDTE